MTTPPRTEQVRRGTTRRRIDRGLGLATITVITALAALIVVALAAGVLSPPAAQVRFDEPYPDYFQRHRPAVVVPEPYVDYARRHPPAVVVPEPYHDYGQRIAPGVPTPENYVDYGRRHPPGSADAP